MNLEYHEAATLTRTPVTGRRIVLDDLHKHAWQLFCDGPRDKRLTERPFAFRFEPFDARRMLITLRSDRPFAGSQPHRLTVNAGDSIQFDYAFVPTRRNERKTYTPPSDEWVPMAQVILTRAGLSLTGAPADHLLGYWKQFSAKGGPVPVLNVQATAVIENDATFASAFLDGIGRRRGYGMGLIRLSPRSATQAQRAA